MKICVMTQSKSWTTIVDAIRFCDDNTAQLIRNGEMEGKIDLSICELNKLSRTDGGMEYYEVVERTAQEVPVQEQLDDNVELFSLLITTSSLVSKAIKMIKNSTTEK